MLLILIVMGSISTLYFFPPIVFLSIWEEEDGKDAGAEEERKKEGNYNANSWYWIELRNSVSSSMGWPLHIRDPIEIECWWWSPCSLKVLDQLVVETTNHFRRVYLSCRNEITSLARRVYFLFIVSCLSCETIAANIEFISQKLSFFLLLQLQQRIGEKISE